MLSLHTSPLVQPGAGDSGGMNVYVRELASALAQAGVDCTTSTRAAGRDLPDEVAVEPGLPGRPRRRPGPSTCPRRSCPTIVDEFTDRRARPTSVAGRRRRRHPRQLLAAAASAGHRLKHELDLPLVSTFHTLARVKAETGDPEPERRDRAEAEVIGCSDAILRRAAPRRRASSGGSTAPGPSASRSCRPASTTPSSRPATAPARAPPSACDEPPGAAVRRPHPAAQGRSTSRSGRWPRCAPRRRRARGRRRAQRRRRATAEAAPGRAAGRRARPRRPGPLRRRRSPTTCCRPTTAPPTSCVVPSRRSLRARRPRGGGVRHPGRGRRRRRAAHARRRRRTGYLVDGRDPARFAGRDRPAPRRSGAAPRAMSAAAAGARPGDYTWLDRRPAAPALRRPHRRSRAPVLESPG